MIRKIKDKPDFSKLLNVLKGVNPGTPVLFEFIMNDKIINHLADDDLVCQNNGIGLFKKIISAYYNGGYDYVSIPAWETDTLTFPRKDKHREESVSLNEGWLINDWPSFEKYPWPDPDAGNFEIYHDINRELPDGMKILACSNGGVLENVIDLVGFENLCIMSLTDEELTSQIFDSVGGALLRYYENLVGVESIGACVVNDDWGFKTQTMLSTDSMRKYVFPWHKKIVQAIHASGKPAILHSCGNLNAVMTDVIEDMQFDGKHSFEDAIVPVEEAYDRWGGRISIMGGLDMNYLATATPREIRKRAADMLRNSRDKGRYALGSGNSISDYIPIENYMAMVDVVIHA